MMTRKTTLTSPGSIVSHSLVFFIVTHWPFASHSWYTMPWWTTAHTHTQTLTLATSNLLQATVHYILKVTWHQQGIHTVWVSSDPHCAITFMVPRQIPWAWHTDCGVRQSIRPAGVIIKGPVAYQAWGTKHEKQVIFFFFYSPNSLSSAITGLEKSESQSRSIQLNFLQVR